MPKAYRGIIPCQKKAQAFVEVRDCADRADALLRLGVKVIEAGYNGMIRCEISGRKLAVNGYSKTVWSGQALPVHVDPAKVDEAFFQ